MYWCMTLLDDRPPRGLSICLASVVCALLRVLLSCLVSACGRSGSAVPPLTFVVVAVPQCRERPLFVRRPPRCHVRHRCVGRGGVGRCHVGHLRVFPELHRRVLRRPTWGLCGGFALHGGVTRRRHAVRGLRVVQNPHCARLATARCAICAAGVGDVG